MTSGPTAPQHTSIRIWHLVHLLLCVVGHLFLVDHRHRVHLSLCIVLEFDVLVFVTETMCAPQRTCTETVHDSPWSPAIRVLSPRRKRTHCSIVLSSFWRCSIFRCNTERCKDRTLVSKDETLERKDTTFDRKNKTFECKNTV